MRQERIGQEIIGYERALSAWKALVTTTAFRSLVIETPKPIAGHHIVGFGASAFVSQEFAREETSNPRPGLNQRIIAGIDSHCSVVLTDAQLRKQNTYGGLCLVVLFTDWRRDILTAEQITEVKLALAQNGVERLAGYRLEHMLLEAIDAVDLEYIESTGVYRLIRAFGGFPSGNKCESARALFAINKTSAESVVGSVATFVFHYTPPVIRFRECQQQLLSAALKGLTDQELAPYLNLKIQTVKKRWASIYAQVAEVFPDLLPESNNHVDHQTRGRQKRHHLLAYLRNHLEELRPFIR
jgi:DNA-binding NarL/FixJ family response regulator